MSQRKPGRVLIVAGSDSGGGAGIQADIKTVTALGGYAMTAIAAITVQNTQSVSDIFPVPPAVTAAQMTAVLTDIGADAVKIGMLGDAATIDAVADVLDRPEWSDIPLVVDPVMVAKSGDRLLAADAVATLKRRLMTGRAIITPNLPEAEEISGLRVRDLDEMRHAAEALRSLGPQAAVLKGGHLDGPLVTDMLITEDSIETFEAARIDSRNTHGTGCTLSSAIATGLAQGMSLRAAFLRARAYLLEAMAQAPGFGHGNGPLWHGHTVGRFG